MVKILIVNPPIRLRDKPRNIPHGLAILANIIRKRISCELFFVDWNAHRYSVNEFQNIVRNTPCDVALIGGLIPTYKYFIQIAKMIKSSHPNCVVLGGGSAAMSIPEVMLENSEVDIVCTGEGEVTTIELLKALSAEGKPDLAHVRGIAYRGRDGMIHTTPPQEMIRDLDSESDLPAYDLLPMDIYLNNTVAGLGRDIDFITSRGCPFDCSFCYQPWGQKNRRHSAEFIKDAILYLKPAFNV